MSGIERSKSGSAAVDPDDFNTIVDAISALQGGSSPWRHDVIPVAYTDIDPATGRAPIFTLQPGEWLFASWRVVTVAFDDSAILSNITAILVPAGASSSEGIDDALSTVDVSSANATNGLIGPDPAQTLNSFVPTMTPVTTPDSAAVAIELDFAADQPLAGDGTAGQLDQHLLILSAP